MSVASIPPRPARSVDDVVALYERWGHHRYDEAISQLDHGLQCAALALRDGATDELVVAALLHDVGHLLHLDATGGGGPADEDLDHESVGARYLSGLFGPAVTAPIAAHVRAKRYLCRVDAGYLAGLSDGSRRSLALQGGPMSDDESRRFAAATGATDAVALRRWDDAGKVDGLEVAPLAAHRHRLQSSTASA